jgi:adenosylhomocysteine nucleosidase
VLALSGMGEGAARRAAGGLLGQCSPALFLSLGFAGALSPDLPPGALVLGESYWRFQPDTDDLQQVAAPAPPRPLSELLAHLGRAGLPACSGSLVSTPYIINKARQGEPLRHLACPVLDLESGAAAEAAARHGLPFLGLRAITDTAFEEIPEFLAQAVGQGAGPGPLIALGWLARDLRRLAPLLRLWWRGRHAARHLAQALEVLLSEGFGQGG